MTTPAYELIRSRRRTMALEITGDCRVIVRAPVHMGEEEIARFVEKHRAWLEEHMARQSRRRAAHPEPGTAERESLIRRAQTELPLKVAHYSELMGLHPTGITITGAEKRFGSCSAKNRICFSWRLMQYPVPAIEYVVVHELAHIRHKDHSAAFYACVARVLPDWKERRALLKM